MDKIKSSVRNVKLGVNELTVPKGCNICGFVSSGHGLSIVITHPETLPDEVSHIVVAVIQVGGRVLEVPDDTNVIRIGTLCDYEDNIYTAYGYQVKPADLTNPVLDV